MRCKTKMTECLLLPYKDLGREHWASLTETRQEIIVNLFHSPKNLTKLSESTGRGISTVNKSIKKLMDLRIVEKNKNKVYHLTDKGDFLSIMLAAIQGQDSKEVYDRLEEKLSNKLEESGLNPVEANKKSYYYRKNLEELYGLSDMSDT